MTGKLLTLDESMKPALPALLALLDVPVDDAAWQAFDPGQRRQKTLDAVRRLLLREAREKLLLLIFEDLHWIDGETQALLDGLVDSLGSARVLLLVNYRPEYRHSWGGKTSYSQLRLDALPAESSGGAAGGAPRRGPRAGAAQAAPRQAREPVLPGGDGPDAGGDEGADGGARPVPPDAADPVHSGASHRAGHPGRAHHRLRREDKRLLQVASVVGKDVPFALLEAVVELPDEALREGLDHLQAAEFLYETGIYPDLEYSFTHALTHEVTYGGLLHDRRRELHARIVDVIETLHRDRLGEQIERLAHHAHRGELREKAVDYLRQAGLKAWMRRSLPDARGWLEQALGVLALLPETPSALEQAFEIRLELRLVLNSLGEARLALERTREAQGIAERLDDDRRRGRASGSGDGTSTRCSASWTTRCVAGPARSSLPAASGPGGFASSARATSSRCTTTGATTSGWSSWPPIILAALPPDWAYEYFGMGAPPSVWGSGPGEP